MGLIARAAQTPTPTPYVVSPSKQFDGNDGSWSTFDVSVGTPSQEFRLLPSTKGGVTFVIAPDGCVKGIDPSDCPNLRGADIFGSSQNIGFQVNASSSWSAIGEYDVSLEQALNYTAKGLYGYDTVSLGPASDSTALSMTQQVVADVAELDYFMGMLPLGQEASSFSSSGTAVQSLLYQLRQNAKIPSFSYAYTAGAKYRLKSVFGSLILGGFDSTRFKPNTNGFSFTFSTDPSRLLTVSVASIMGTNTLKGTFSMTSQSHFSVIDSSVAQLWLPADVCTQFETAFGLTYDPKTELYLVNDTIHQQLLSKNPTVTIKLTNSPQDSTTNYTNIVLPYAAFDLQASYPFYSNATNYFPIRRAANDTQYVLGRTLLQEAYLMVDYERANFTVAQTVWPDPLPAANVVTIVSPHSEAKSNTSSGLSKGAIAGIVIAVFLIGIVVSAGGFWFFKRRRPAKKYELGGKQLSDSDRDFTGALKAHGPQEVAGTPLTELASHPTGNYTSHQQGQKTVINMSDTPQELHAESLSPSAPRWQEVVLPPRRFPHDTDEEAESPFISDEEFRTGDSGPPSGVSPMTPLFQRYRY